MARGFLSGVLWGGVVGVGVSGAASVMAPGPVAPDVVDAAPQEAVTPAVVETASSEQTASQTDSAPVTTSTAPQAPAPEQEAALALDTQALSVPDGPTAVAPVILDPIAPETGAAGIVVQDLPAVIPTPQALAPMEPQEPDAVAIDTDPADPPVVDVAEDTPVEELPEEAPVEEVPEDVVVAEEIPEVPEEVAVAEEVPETAQTPQTSQDNTQLALVAPEPEAPAAPEAPEETPTEAVAPAPEDTDAAGPRIGTPVGSLVDRDNGVTIRRPSSATLGQVDDGEAEAIVPEAPASSDARPISRFATAFERDSEKPLMAIVLIDDGSSPVAGAAGIAALRGFPYPLTYAVDTTLPDAVARMEIYRKEGFEVMAMVDLPPGAQPEDAEIAFGAILPQMDEVVGVLEGTQGGFQGARDVADQVTSILLQTGHGLVAQNQGLNTMPKLARKEGVPADPVFRDFDSKGQTAAVIRRFLDQAAFKAGQEGAVVMLGRLRPDTVSALLLWGLQDRAGKVSLAPISAVLLRDP